VKPTGDAEVVQVFVAKSEAFSQVLPRMAARRPEMAIRKFCLESTLRASAKLRTSPGHPYISSAIHGLDAPDQNPNSMQG